MLNRQTVLSAEPSFRFFANKWKFCKTGGSPVESVTSYIRVVLSSRVVQYGVQRYLYCGCKTTYYINVRGISQRTMHGGALVERVYGAHYVFRLVRELDSKENAWERDYETFECNEHTPCVELVAVQRTPIRRNIAYVSRRTNSFATMWRKYPLGEGIVFR